MKRFSAHTHLATCICVHSLHMSLITLALLCYMLLCVYVSSNSFPVVVRKRPRMHLVCLFLARRSPLENTLGFSLGFTKIGETAVWIGGLAAEWNRRFNSAVGWPPIWTVVSDLIDFILGFISAVETAVTKPSNGTAVFPLFLSGQIRRSRMAAWPPIETADWRVSLKLT